MAWSSNVPDVVAALVALWQGNLPGVTVYDGPSVSAAYSDVMLTVGFTDADDLTGATASTANEGLCQGRDAESIAVLCQVIARGGSTAIPTRRAAAFAAVDAAGQALDADHTLGGLVMRTRIDDLRLEQAQAEGGALALVSFTVFADALTK